MKKASEVIASQILNTASKNPQAAWDSIHALIQENREMREILARLYSEVELKGISLQINERIMNVLSKARS